MFLPLRKALMSMRPCSPASRMHLVLLVGVPAALLMVFIVMPHLHSKAIEQKGILAYQYRRLDFRIRTLGIRGTDMEALEVRNPPFVPQPTSAQHTEYLQCLLEPTLTLNGSTGGSCADAAAVPGRGAQQASVLLDNARCAGLAGFQEEDVRMLPFLPSAVYARPGTADFEDLLHAFCGDFQFLPETVPFLPRSRPLVMLDAGSGSGFSAALLVRAMRFQGTLVWVEPDEDRALMGRRNTAAVQGTPGLHIAGVNRALVSSAEVKRKPEVPLRAVGGEGSPSGRSVRTISLPQLLERGQVASFDFIKLSLSGAEAELFRDAASRSVLCNARCILAAVPADSAGGADAEAAEAWSAFVATGCPRRDRFTELDSAGGTFRVACRGTAWL